MDELAFAGKKPLLLNGSPPPSQFAVTTRGVNTEVFSLHGKTQWGIKSSPKDSSFGKNSGKEEDKKGGTNRYLENLPDLHYPEEKKAPPLNSAVIKAVTQILTEAAIKHTPKRSDQIKAEIEAKRKELEEKGTDPVLIALALAPYYDELRSVKIEEKNMHPQQPPFISFHRFSKKDEEKKPD
jgi:hypothetical protein